MATRLIAASALASVALAACGGGNDKADIRRTVREFVKATNRRDASKFCGSLVTKKFLEQATLATGDEAKKACREQLKSLKTPMLKLVDVADPKVHGDRARVQVTLEQQGQPRIQSLRMKKEGGDWRIAGGTGG